MGRRKSTPEEKAASLERKKAYMKAYHQTPEYKAKEKARQQTPEYKARNKARQKAYYQTPEYKAKEKARQQNPEYKAYQKAYGTKCTRQKSADQFFVMTAALGDLTKSTEKQ
jgi:hypothetical protein